MYSRLAGFGVDVVGHAFDAPVEQAGSVGGDHVVQQAAQQLRLLHVGIDQVAIVAGNVGTEVHEVVGGVTLVQHRGYHMLVGVGHGAEVAIEGVGRALRGTPAEEPFAGDIDLVDLLLGEDVVLGADEALLIHFAHEFHNLLVVALILGQGRVVPGAGGRCCRTCRCGRSGST